MTRREILLSSPLALAQSAPREIPRPVVDRFDEGVSRYMEMQQTGPQHPSCGNIADATGLYHPGSSSGLMDAFSTALVCKQSKHYQSAKVMERLKLAASYMARHQNAQGNIDLLITNFNSPPDTAFAVRSAAAGALLAQRAGAREVLAQLEPFLKKGGAALIVGGIHTPNHRWVVCAALAQLNELFPNPDYVRRIDQWLAEGIDIDPDGQFTERSTGGYNIIVDSALIAIADKLKRPEYLEPVRRNLESNLFFLQPGDEIETDISRRQDQYTKVDIGRYWFPLHWMAVKDRNGVFGTLAKRHFEKNASVGMLMTYPELLGPVPEAPVPEDYRKTFPSLGCTRIRRGQTAATIAHRGSSRFFNVRRGGAVVYAVRFASAFFGKGQFVPQEAVEENGVWRLTQKLEAPYYQPFTPGRRIDMTFDTTRWQRPTSEVCRLEQSVEIRETKTGFTLRLRSHGTGHVPLAVEIAFRDDAAVSGATALKEKTWLLESGYATIANGSDRLRIGPGAAPNRYIEVRGAQPRLPANALFITGVTPFDHTLEVVAES